MGEEEEKKEELKILLVEDEKAHVRIIRHALESSEREKRIWVCQDGAEALDFLYNRGDYASKTEYPKPDVILLDLRLPKIDGLEVLNQIKSEERLNEIPVVVLTASKRDDDITGAYQDGVKSYLLKSTFIVEKSGKMDGLLDMLLSLG